MTLPWLTHAAPSPLSSDLASTLEIGRVATVEMTARQSPKFTLEAEAGKLYLFEVEQGGFELVVDVLHPDGTTESFDFPNYRDDPTHRDEAEMLLLEPRQGLGDEGGRLALLFGIAQRIHFLELSIEELLGLARSLRAWSDRA